ncbi:MAG: MarR family transcriptional regulator [Donghicola eburneus]|nr:MarR family transcriptional regulator [Donghicola eburneus]MCI5042499.1 MarR family transcriptional regulator [Donghicola eburneus]
MGLTYPQYLIMIELWDECPRTSKDLAERLQLPASALTPLIRKLREKGLIKRIQDGKDKRSFRITLTDKGEALKEPVQLAREGVVCATGLDASEYDAITELMKNLRDAMT